MKTKKHFIWWLIAFFLSSVIFLISTQIGLSWTAYALNRLIPGELTFSQLKGRLLGPLSFKNMHYENHTAHVQIEDLTASWQPLTIFSHIRMTKAHAKKVIVVQKDSAARTGNGTRIDLTRYLKLPFNAQLEQVTLDELVIELRSGVRLNFYDLLLSGRQTDHVLHINQAAFRLYGLVWSGKGTIDLRQQAIPVNLQTMWYYDLPGEAAFSAAGKITGNLDHLTVDQNLRGDISGKLTGYADDVVNDIRWNLNLDADAMRIKPYHKHAPDIIAMGRTLLTGDKLHVGINANLESKPSPFGRFAAQLRIEYRDRTWRFADVRITELDQKGELTLNASIHDQTKLMLKAGWSQLQTTEAFGVLFSSHHGELQLSGDLASPRFETTLQFSDNHITDSQWQVSGETDFKSVKFSHFDAAIAKGRLRGKGKLAWQPRLSWQMQASGKDIDAANFFEHLHSRLSFELSSQGDWSAQPAFTFHVNKLNGSYRGHAVEGGGRIVFDHDRYQFKKVKLTVGKAEARIDGEIADNWRLQWQTRIPDLKTIVPGGSGRIYLEGLFSGTTETPKATASVDVDRLRWKQLGVSNLKGNASVTFNQTLARLLKAGPIEAVGGVNQIKLNLNGRAFRWNTQIVTALHASVTGSAEDHHLELRLDSKYGSVDLGLNGRHEKGKLLQQLQSANIRLPSTDLLKLSEPVQIEIAADQINLEPACFVQRNLRLCQTFQWAAENWRAHTEMENFPIPLLSDYMPEFLALSTTVEHASLLVESNRKGQWKSSGTLKTSPGQITYTLPNGEVLTSSHRPSSGEWVFINNHLSAEFNLALDKGGIRTKADLRLGNTLANSPLALNTYINVPEIHEVAALLPYVKGVNGRLEAHLQLQGPLLKPEFTAKRASLRDGVGTVNFSGTHVRNLNLNMNTEGNIISWKGDLIAGSGKLNFSGFSTLKGKNQGELKLKGSGIQLLNTKEHKLVVSPDLVLKLDGTRATAEGKVHIPSGMIQPRDLSVARKASDDQVFIGEEAREKPLKYSIASNVDLSFSDQVEFKLKVLPVGFIRAVTVEGKINDSIRIVDNPGQPSLANGELNIKKGKVSVFGQTLSVETGRIIYTGQPLEHPAIDIVAVRESDDIRAGVTIRGAWPKIKLGYFSNPAMTETQIISFIITGSKTLDQEQGKSIESEVAAYAGTELFSRLFAKSIGLDEIQVKPVELTGDPATGNGENRQEYNLQLGKYVSPKLYIGYGIGLVEHAHSLNIRYRLKKWLSLEASTSADQQSGDILITRETEKTGFSGNNATDNKSGEEP